MSIHYNLYLPCFALSTPDQLVSNYDKMRDSEVHPADLAVFMLSLANTYQTLPSPETSSVYRDQQSFINGVLGGVDETLIADASVTGTNAGLEAALLWVSL